MPLPFCAGKYDDPDEPGQINHYQALSTALAATVGMGNITGVALAITMGGPGAIFWMWVSALLGVTTKYFTCTLAVMFRGTRLQRGVAGRTHVCDRGGPGKKLETPGHLFLADGNDRGPAHVPGQPADPGCSGCGTDPQPGGSRIQLRPDLRSDCGPPGGSGDLRGDQTNRQGHRTDGPPDGCPLCGLWSCSSSSPTPTGSFPVLP